MKKNINEQRRDPEPEARLRKLLRRMTYNEKLMLLSLIEGTQSGQESSAGSPGPKQKTA